MTLLKSVEEANSTEQPQILPQVSLWRSAPVEIPGPVAADSLDRTAVLPSARQGLDEAVRSLGLGRRDYVGVPDYASHCVLDFVGRRATPVPIRELSSAPRAILAYDQWGWQKSPGARMEVRTRYPNAAIIWDRVDALPLCFESAARSGEGEAEVQLFSLSKTLGAGGGGLLWICGSGWVKRTSFRDAELIVALEALSSQMPTRVARNMIDRFVRNECDGYSPRLSSWLGRSNVTAASLLEHAERRERVRLCCEFLNVSELPEWMRAQIADAEMPAPGIVPLPLLEEPAFSPAAIQERFGIEAQKLHFNFRDSYIDQQWVPVIAMPVHSEVPVDALDRVLSAVSRRGGYAR